MNHFASTEIKFGVPYALLKLLLEGGRLKFLGLQRESNFYYIDILPVF